MSPRDRELTGIVLHVGSFGEAHRMVEALTAEEGRLAAVARNARASRRRFAGALDAFTTARLELVVAPGLWTLRAAALVDPRLGIRADLERLTRASLCCEAVRFLLAEHAAAPAAFAALGAALDGLAAGNLAAAATFLGRLLAVAGIAPGLEACVRCGREPEAVAGVDVAAGGVVCAACAPGRARLPATALAVLGGAPAPDLEAARAAEALAVEWIEAQTGRSLRSAAPAWLPRGG